MITNIGNRKYAATYKGWSARVIARIRHKAIKRDVPFDLDIEWYREKLSGLVCEVTGIKFQYEYWKEGAITPWTPTIDKKDPSLGYLKDNCQVVIWMYNVAKQDFTHEDVLTMAVSLNR